MSPDWRDAAVQRRENDRLRQFMPADHEQAMWARRVSDLCLTGLIAGGVALCMIAWLWK